MNSKYALSVIIVILFFTSCKYDKGEPHYQGFPEQVGKIIINKCATTGCHNDKSKGAAGGLSMSSWDNLFEGGNGSACIIPYRNHICLTDTGQMFLIRGISVWRALQSWMFSGCLQVKNER